MFVNESIDKFLKPKERKDIDKNINVLINNFIDSITSKDFNYAIKNAEPYIYNIKKYKKGNDIFYLTSEDNLSSLVDFLILTYDEVTEKNKFPEMADFWTDLEFNKSISKEDRKTIKNKIIYKIAKKFNVEY